MKASIESCEVQMLVFQSILYAEEFAKMEKLAVSDLILLSLG